jgi:ferritin-like metal-binding protein YciE
MRTRRTRSATCSRRGAAAKVEHYEICSYKSLIKLATQLGLNEAVTLFQESLGGGDRAGDRADERDPRQELP